ncbi:hypothetical protein F5883DRAFT_478116 [Diaporthe sp. PMI_573]|nr:hypothetical protein F5883DRAFT_478116 [Diaporthaceae sp. PMI_573]
MRLLYNCEDDFKVTEDLEHDIPRYAILSHTWGLDTEEVNFQDLVDGTGRGKIGFDKIEFCAAQAKHDGLQYFWVDTCCIDKSNNAELSEAINSMFCWYQNATRCYVYLSDVAVSSCGRDNQQSKHIWEAAFRASRWFTRGWTLQELLASTSVEFFTKERQLLGDKRSLEQQIHRITGIAVPALQGSSLAHFSIKERFQWANTRETKREEDWAYCLQGIFGVSMPVTYGEGKAQAIARLQTQITKNQECFENLRPSDPRDDKRRIEQTKGGLLHDCYKWILGNANFQRWQNDQSQLLWIRGDPGKGKTMLLCGVINELEKLPATNTSYFFCQATDTRINTATAVLRGLIHLLIDQQPSLISHVREKYDQAGKQLFEDANTWIALSAIFNNTLRDPGLGTTYLVIDALDECITGLEDLLDLIIKTSTANSRVKWIVSSRNWPKIEKALGSAAQNFSLSLELNRNSVSAAVATYIDFKIDTLAKENDYDLDTQVIVRSHLIQNAGGTFLWVALVCQELAKLSAWEVDEERLAMFPPGLDDLYNRMMDQIGVSRHSQLCKSILATLSIAYRPITLDELPSLVEIPRRAVGKDKALAEIIGTCGSFLSPRGRTIYFTHQSAKDFLVKKEPQVVFPAGKQIEHNAILTRSIKAMSQILKQDIYRLQRPGVSIEEIERQRPNPDPLAPIQYACVYWIEHFRESENTSLDAAVGIFIKKHFLRWFEALSILKSTSEGVFTMAKLVSSLKKSASESQLLALARDMHRFARSYRGIIEKAPLQAYVSALIFSPTNSLTRKLFESKVPGFIVRKPYVELNWDACLSTLEGHSDMVISVAFSADGRRLASGSRDHTVKIWDAESGANVRTLEGHSGGVTSVAFSADGRRLASGSRDHTVKIWDVESGACITTCPVDRATKELEFDLDNSYLYTDAGSISLEDLFAIRTPRAATTAFSLYSCYRGYNISSDNSWIKWNDDNVLWLPQHFRPNVSNILREIVLVGSLSGRVWSIQFSPTEFPVPQSLLH